MKSLALIGVFLAGSFFSNFTYAQEFDFSNPKIDKSPDKETKKNDIPLGSFGGLNLGVLFDVRYMAVGPNAPGTVIHVNEL